MNHQAASRSSGEGPKGPGKDDGMKKLEKGNMRISPSGMHDQMMFFIISGVGIDVFYIYAYISYFKPPTPIALDVVIFWIFGLIFNAVVFTMIIALSRVYIVSTKGITVILLGIFRHLYPWERFQMVGLYPNRRNTWRGIHDGMQHRNVRRNSRWTDQYRACHLSLAAGFDFSTADRRGTHAI